MVSMEELELCVGLESKFLNCMLILREGDKKNPTFYGLVRKRGGGSTPVRKFAEK